MATDSRTRSKIAVRHQIEVQKEMRCFLSRSLGLHYQFVLWGLVVVLISCVYAEMSQPQSDPTDENLIELANECQDNVEVDDHSKLYKRPAEDDDTCNQGDEDGNASDEKCGKTEAKDEPRLVRLEGEKVGHVEEIELIPGNIHYLKTISMKPVIFEIADFFTVKECDHIISLANKQGMQESVTIAPSSGRQRALQLRDTNGDGKLGLREMQQTLEDGYDMYLDEDDVRKMYAELGIDKDNDGFISREEIKGSHSIGLIRDYIMQLQIGNPAKKSRFSEQTWIYPDQIEDPLVASFQQRIHKLARLPQALIDKFNYFQVVHYGEHGHYNAHLDSGTISSQIACCHVTANKHCRICRFMTIMVYLNVVDEGGQTAFPIANNDSFNIEVFRQTGKMNLNARCNEANLKVQPEQGKAVIWYNHFIDEATGWLGDIDPFTWHGGCAVTKGQKWIMNRWIAVSDDRELDLS